jgi:hypothetical protein
MQLLGSSNGGFTGEGIQIVGSAAKSFYYLENVSQ